MTQSNTHAGRTALITGSTSGIGLGIAVALASEGANVVVNGLGDAQQVDAALASVRAAASGDVVFEAADMRDPDEIRALVVRVCERFGAVDLLINNAGIQHVAPVQEFPVDKWDEIIAINLSSSFHTIAASVPGMLGRGRGRIVNIASAHAFSASPYKAAYVAAKHGIAGLTRTVALEVARDNITVNAIAPGYVETPLVTNQIAPTAAARGITEKQVVEDVMLARQPTKRFVAIDEVASLAVYLCSDAASSITGTVLPIDGGWSAL